MKILLADDTRSILDLISLYLKKMGHEVIAVSDGESAIEIFKKELPDLIILDVLMPTMDGFECARRIREIGGEDWIPIIFLSAAVDEKSVVQGINAGGDDYLTKPISKVLLEAKIKAMQRIASMRKKLYETTQELSILSVTDSLTGAYNRFELDRIIKQKIEKANAEHTLLALFFIDLDNFKSINDNLGHYIGDLLLKEVSARLNAILRKHDFLARMGGDEFAIIFQIEKVDNIEFIANKIMNTLSSNYNLEGHLIYLTVSFGIACYPFAGGDEKKLMQSADIAMYQAKTLGRNNYQYYTEAMIEKNKLHSEVQEMLREALMNHELYMIYQPIFNIETQEIVGIEALIRWLHPEKGLILPEIFIPIAEESDLINKVGELAFREVCSQVVLWQKEGYSLKYSINVSPKQLLQKKFPDLIKLIMVENKVAPEQFEMEITETILMNHLHFSEKIINEIHKIGVKISIDDFGTGYSSLVHLKNFPIASIKIDKSFIRDIASDPNDAIIVSALIALGKNLGLQVIAEGIETQEQLQFLKENNCPQGQGYLFCPPLTAKEMTHFLKDNFIKN